MSDRLDLHDDLKMILGSNNVYFQAPESFKMVYPCFKYQFSNVRQRFANDANYHYTSCYQVTYLDKNPDNNIVDKMLSKFTMCQFDRHYVSDNINHYVFRLYY